MSSFRLRSNVMAKADLINNNKRAKSPSPDFTPVSGEHQQSSITSISAQSTQPKAILPFMPKTTFGIKSQANGPFSKMKILKQNSLMYDIFARSSSASFERQASCESATYNTTTTTNNSFLIQNNIKHNNSQSFKLNNNLNATSKQIIPSTSSLASSVISNFNINSNNKNNNSLAMLMMNNQMINSNRNIVRTVFKPPCLFSLNVNSLNQRIKVNYCFTQHTNLSSSSGISTLKSGRSCSAAANNTTTPNNGSVNWNNMNRSKNSASSLAFLLNRQSSVSTNCPTMPTSSGIGSSYTCSSSDQARLMSSTNSATSSCSSSQLLSSILFETYLEFADFVQLFRSFYIHMRKDLKEIFDRYAILVNSKDTDDQNVDRTWTSTRRLWKNLIFKV